MRAFCVPQGALQATARAIGSIGDGHSEHREGQVDPLGVIAFFCSHLLAMHVARRVKTSALLTGDI